MEKVQRSVTFAAPSREKTSVSTVMDIGPDSRQGEIRRKTSRPQTTGDMATSVVHITSQSSSRGYKVRQTRPAKSTWLIRKEQRRRRDEVDRVIQRQLTLPAISGDKLRKIRELRERPVELNQEQRESINQKSFEEIISQFKQLRMEQERQKQGLSVNRDPMQDLMALRSFSEKVHANIEKLKKNSLMEAAVNAEKQKRLEQQKRSQMMIYQEEDMSTEERIEKNRRLRRRKLVARFQMISQKVANLYKKRMVQLEQKAEEKLSTKNRLLGKAANTKHFNSLFEAVVYMGYVKETEETLQLKRTWDDVRKCRYLRGHEPEDMRVPDDQKLSDFVFGK